MHGSRGCTLSLQKPSSGHSTSVTVPGLRALDTLCQTVLKVSHIRQYSELLARAALVRYVREYTTQKEGRAGKGRTGQRETQQHPIARKKGEALTASKEVSGSRKRIPMVERANSHTGPKPLVL